MKKLRPVVGGASSSRGQQKFDPRMTISTGISGKSPFIPPNRNQCMDELDWEIDATSDTNQKISRLMKQNKLLKEENSCLRTETQEVRHLYDQLLNEGAHEQYDERRVNVLKSQILQLERQMMVMNDAFSTRAMILMEIENALDDLASKLRQWIAVDNRSPTVPVERADIMNLVQRLTSVKHRLNKNCENMGSMTSKPLLLISDLINQRNQGQITFLDICSGNIDHINLKRVALLESNMSELHKQLIQLSRMLSMSCTYCQHTLPSQSTNRTLTHIEICNKMLVNCCQELLVMGILVPSAPWSKLKEPIMPDVKLETVLSRLPNFVKSKQQEGRAVITSLMKLLAYLKHKYENEVSVCNSELDYHKSIYDLQLKYINELMLGITNSYSEFEEQISSSLCPPLQAVLDKYEMMERSPGDKTLKNFLMIFKEKSPQIKDIVELLNRPDNHVASEGLGALSEFGENFFSKLRSMELEHATKRDLSISELNQVLTDADNELREHLANLSLNSQEKPDKTDQCYPVGEDLTTFNGSEYSCSVHSNNVSLVSVMSSNSSISNCSCAYGQQTLGPSNDIDHVDKKLLPVRISSSIYNGDSDTVLSDKTEGSLISGVWNECNMTPSMQTNTAQSTPQSSNKGPSTNTRSRSTPLPPVKPKVAMSKEQLRSGLRAGRNKNESATD